MRAKFEVDCREIGFSRSEEIPIDNREYCHQLADDLARAMDYYELRVENHKMKQALEEIFEKSQDNWAAARAETALGRGKVVSYDD